MRKVVDFILLLSGNRGVKTHWGSENVSDKLKTKPVKIERGSEGRSTDIAKERMEEEKKTSAYEVYRHRNRGKQKGKHNDWWKGWKINVEIEEKVKGKFSKIVNLL